MELDERTCSRARLARDARFDGKFFIGVLTTKIYCRPICRSRTSKESNVRYFPSAAAAAEAGFRPCLRCRPEHSPGMHACPGTHNTVTRALRLISEMGLERGGVEALAQHLGVGSRHLRRLFLRHLGATPIAVAQTHRLQFAKRLIDETNLCMGQIAVASGFGCVRRFNGTIRKVYRRTPTQIRSMARQKPCEPEDQYLFHLNFRPPYDWKRVTEFLATRAIPGVEIIEAGTYRRSICINEKRGYFEVSFDTDRNAVNVRIQIGDPCSLLFIIERVRAIFDLDADWATIARTLGADLVLASYIKSDPGLRVPGCWNAFEFATRAICEQEIDIGRANALAGCIVRNFGQPFGPVGGITHLFPTPKLLANADIESIGLPRVKADAIRALARGVRDGQICFEKTADLGALLTRLHEIPGIGRCAAQWISMRALREPDAIPWLDPDLAQALGVASAREVEERSEAWRPWRAYAAIYLWRFGYGSSARQNAS